MHDIICFGGCVLDTFLETEAELISIDGNGKHESLIAYPLGSKILVKDVHYEMGGSAANAAVAFKRLGFDTMFLSILGRDEIGDSLLKRLRNEGIPFSGPRKGKTGTSVILDSQADDRTILTYKGCMEHFTPEHVPAELDTQWLFCTSMLGESWPSMKLITRQAHNQGIRIALSPNQQLASLGLKELCTVLGLCDVFVLNLEEARIIAGEHDPATLCLRLKDSGPRTVAVTDGKNGAALYHEGMIYEARPGKVTVVETTGAGDAFAASLVAGLMMKLSFEECIRLAFVNAESVISHRGAQNILLSREEAMKRVKADTRSILKRSA